MPVFWLVNALSSVRSSGESMPKPSALKLEKCFSLCITVSKTLSVVACTRQTVLFERLKENRVSLFFLIRPSHCDSYLVDPASSHMLVSKIKPCMSKYKHLYCETANGSLNQL